ncbi:MAG: c-type cytochrome [Chloroflexi bacterium]|nr:c-type cytochrome [Chloroflexota bacterium]
MNRWAKVSALTLGLVVAGLAYVVEAAPPGQSAGEGQVVFQQKCAACHTIGQGDRSGPDLKGVTARRDRAWLTRWIATPDRLIAQGDPIAAEMLKKYSVPMPNMGLSDAEVSSVVAYLEAQSGGAAAAAPQPAQAPAKAPAQAPVQTSAVGDPGIGKQLFSGGVVLQNGGSPCIACHSVAGIGALGGGVLGPDLTGSYSKYGDAGMSTVLASLPFPTMQPIFGSRPLTPVEQANLKAFFQQATAAERPAEALGLLAIIAVVGAGAFFVLIHFLWRGRLAAVRQPLVRGR